jgi:hypothetical protein
MIRSTPIVTNAKTTNPISLIIGFEYLWKEKQQQKYQWQKTSQQNPFSKQIYTK